MGQTRIPSIDIQPQDPGAIVPGGTVTITLDDGGGFMAPAGATREQLRALVDQFVESKQSGTDFPFETFTGEGGAGADGSGGVRNAIQAVLEGMAGGGPPGSRPTAEWVERVIRNPELLRDVPGQLKDLGAIPTMGGIGGALLGAPLGHPYRGGMLGAGGARALQGWIEGDPPQEIAADAGGEALLEGVLPGIGGIARAGGRRMIKASIPKIESILELLGGRGGEPAGLDELVTRITNQPGFRLEPQARGVRQQIVDAEDIVKQRTAAAEAAGVTIDPEPIVNIGRRELAEGAAERRIGGSGPRAGALDVVDEFERARTRDVTTDVAGGVTDVAGGLDDIIAADRATARAAGAAGDPAAVARAQQAVREAQAAAVTPGTPDAPAREFIPQTPTQVRQDLADTRFLTSDSPGADEMGRILREALSEAFKKATGTAAPFATQASLIPVRRTLDKAVIGSAGAAVGQPRLIAAGGKASPFFTVPLGRKSMFAAGQMGAKGGEALRAPGGAALLRILRDAFSVDDPVGGTALTRRQLTP